LRKISKKSGMGEGAEEISKVQKSPPVEAEKGIFFSHGWVKVAVIAKNLSMTYLAEHFALMDDAETIRANHCSVASLA